MCLINTIFLSLNVEQGRHKTEVHFFKTTSVGREVFRLGVWEKMQPLPFISKSKKLWRSIAK